MLLTVTTGLQRVNVVVSAVYRLAICLHRKCVDCHSNRGKVTDESFVHLKKKIAYA